MTHHALRATLLASALLFFGPAFAGEGHDHGEAAPAASGTALPRFAAQSELFELVGVLDGKQLTLYLDRYADNAPVTGAAIELEIAGAKLVAEPHGDDYEATLAETPKPGVLPITATVTAGNEIDLLAGELDLHEAAHAETPVANAWQARAPWAIGVLALLGLVAFALRRAFAARASRLGGAA